MIRKIWITPKDVAAAFPDVPFWVHYSRHHMKANNGKAARPKFHIALLTDPVTGPEQLKRLKERAHEVFPYFDPKAMDSAHFFYGTENPQVEFHPGNKTLNEFLGDDEFDANMPQGSYGKKLVIEEGRRNATQRHHEPFCRKAHQKIWIYRESLPNLHGGSRQMLPASLR